MLIKLIFAAVILFFLFKWIHKFKKTPQDQQKQKLFQLFLIGVAVAILFGVVTGKMHWFGAVIAGALPFLRNGLGLIMRFAPLLIRSTGGKARFNTEHLNVEIDLNNKSVTGVVTKGLHEGKQIQQLTPQELDELLEYYQSRDKKSVFFIKAVKKGFTAQNDPPPQTFIDPDRQEALQILGLSDNPSKEEIIKAHRKLINKLHPDRGGNDFLASRVNQARDTLLKDIPENR